VFGIPLLSRFKIKEIAGNIIPAIATTNAIIAGYIVVQALKVLAGQSVEACSSVYLCRGLSGKRKDKMVVHSRLHPPNPACFVCAQATVNVALDLRTATVELLVKKVLQEKLSFHEPTVYQGERLLYECGDLDDDEVALNEAKLPKRLTEAPFNLADQAILEVDDSSQNLKCKLIITNAKLRPEEHPEGFTLDGKAGATASALEQAAEDPGGAKGTAGDDDLEILDATGASVSKKRKTANGKAPMPETVDLS